MSIGVESGTESNLAYGVGHAKEVLNILQSIEKESVMQ